MSTTATQTASFCRSELEIEIDAPIDRTWKALMQETNLWWLPDFHVAGDESTIEFDPSAGGKGLVETTPDGGVLVWYSTHMYLPSKYQVYLIGHVAPEWGGPTTSSLRLALVARGDGCTLQVTDARHGNIDDASVSSFQEGWKQLFTDGLKAFAETN